MCMICNIYISRGVKKQDQRLPHYTPHRNLDLIYTISNDDDFVLHSSKEGAMNFQM